MNRTAAVIALLTVGVLAVGVAAVPVGAQDAGNETQNETETVIVEAALVGTTAENVTTDDADALDQQVASELGVSSEQVAVVETDGSTAVEVRDAGVTPEMLADAIEATNASVDRADVRPGVTDRTRNRVANIVDARLSVSSQFDGSVIRVESDRLYVNVTREVNATGLSALFQRGEVQVIARTPDGEEADLFTQAEVRQAGDVIVTENFSVVPARLTEDGASTFSEELRRLNFTDEENIDACDGDPNVTATGYCLETWLDGEPVATGGISEGLAASVRMGVFTENEQLGIITGNESQARAVRLAVLTAAHPTDVTIESVDDADAVSVEPNWPPDSDDGDDGNDGDGNDGDGNDTTQTPAETTEPTGENGTEDGSGSSGPGFTPLVALAGVAVALLALRRR